MYSLHQAGARKFIDGNRERIMKKQLRFSETMAVGSMLFGLFFGAGNLIFPASMGQLPVWKYNRLGTESSVRRNKRPWMRA